CNSSMWSILPEKHVRASEFVIERTPQEFAFVQPEKRAPQYFIAVASNAAKGIGGQVSYLVDISNELLGQRERALNGVAAERDNLKATLSALEHQLSASESQIANLQATADSQQRMGIQKQ